MTFRKKKKFSKDTKKYTLHKHSQRSLGMSANLEEACVVPSGESLNEWLAVHVVEFFNKICIILKPIEKKLEDDKTKSMGAGGYEYRWKGGKYRKATVVRPFEYINLALDEIEGYVGDPEIFPADDSPFPKNYIKIVKLCFKKMFRILAHLMLEKCSMIVEAGIISHVNTIFKHFVLFVFVHRLLRRVELTPMQSWIEKNLPSKYGKKLRKKR